MDWGMMQNPAKAAVCVGGVYPTAEGDDEKPPHNVVHALLRPRLRFGLGISLSILMTDVVLRFSWTLRFYHALFPSADSFVLCSQFLEVVRYVQYSVMSGCEELLYLCDSHKISIYNLPINQI